MQMVFKDGVDESVQQELLYMMVQEQQRLQARKRKEEITLAKTRPRTLRLASLIGRAKINEACLKYSSAYGSDWHRALMEVRSLVVQYLRIAGKSALECSVPCADIKDAGLMPMRCKSDRQERKKENT
eukprot:1159117-Pelagomonas_calceolata.AAC.2